MTQFTHVIDGSILSIRPVEGEHPSTTFDCGALGFHPDVANGINRALVARYGHLAIETQRLVIRSVKQLASALKHEGLVQALPLPPNTFEFAVKWTFSVESQSTKTSRSLLCLLIQVLTWMRRNTPKLISKHSNFLLPRYQRPEKTERASWSEEQTKAALRACYIDIEQTRQRISKAQALMAGEAATPEDLALSNLVREWDEMSEGGRLTVAKIHKKPGGGGFLKRLKTAGGADRLKALLYIQCSDVFPFYLATLIQTSGNPQSILALDRACIQDHPIRTDIEVLKWDKHRSGREQIADFPKSKQFSAPNLLRQLMELTTPLLKLAHPRIRSAVFLVKNPRGGVNRISWQQVHNEYASFLEKHSLEKVELRSVRKTGGRLHQRAGKSLATAKKRLNHKDVSTTQIYTSLGDRKEDHDRTILRFQGLMLSETLKQDAPNSKAPKRAKALSSAATQTVFGFSCKDPLSGVAVGSRLGEVCLQFMRCATCPGAIVPLDDIRVVGKLMSASLVLSDTEIRAVREGWTPRFNLLFKPIKTIIDTELLPAASPLIKAKALGFVNKDQFPRLE